MADPLSVGASIVAIIQSASVAIKILKRIRSSKFAHIELLSMLNTVTDLKAVLTTVHEDVDFLGRSTNAAAQDSYRALPHFISRADRALKDLVKFLETNIPNNTAKVMYKMFNEEKLRKELAIIKGAINEARQNLHAAMSAANLRVSQGVILAIQDIAIAQEEQHNRTTASLDQILSILIQRDSGDSVALQGSPLSPGRLDHSSGHDVSTITPLQLPGSSAATSQMCVTAQVVLDRCDPFCTCQCHIRARGRTPRWLSAVIGTLFYSYVAKPSLSIRPCNKPPSQCRRTSLFSPDHFTYYFPTWILRTALIGSTWKDVHGQNASWTVTTPREISEIRPCWDAIKMGQIDRVRSLIARHDMSPFDVDRNGMSVLQFAVDKWQLEICAILLNDGAKWQFRGRNGVSAGDIARYRVLIHGGRDSRIGELRRLMGKDEDNYDMEMKHLHRVVVGLSGMSLQNVLELDASSINDPDGTGMTPLMWASARGDVQSARSLLSSGADCYAADTERTTALHFAAMEGSEPCISAIIDAGGDVNAADIHGYTPLHFAVQNAASEAVIKLLIEAGANLSARTKYGWAPLFLSVNNNLPTVLSILVKFGDDINALDDRNSPPIARAIALSYCDVLRVLCKERAHFSWNGKGGNGSNIIKEAARFGSVEVMNILAETDNELISYDASEVYRYFNGREHPKLLTNDSGPPEALAAFGNLLAKRGRQEIAGSRISTHVSVSENLSTSAGQDENECEESEVFEDALETIPSI